MKKLIVFAIFALLVTGAFSVPAYADLYTFNLDNCTGTCGGGPYGQIEVTQNGANTVNVNVTLNSNIQFVSTGFPVSFGFNLLSNPMISLANVSSGWALKSTAQGTLHVDGFGNLDYGLVCTGCGTGGGGPLAGPLKFDVIATGLTPGAFAELSHLPPGSTQAYFVADVLGSNGKTGPIGATAVPNSVPEPAGVFLVGTALLGLGWKFRNRVS